MKVLFVCNNIDRKNENPFVQILVHSLQNAGINVDYGLDNFWNNYQEYDLLHFQWPEKIFKGGKNIDIPRITKHMDLLRSLGIKTIITCHNFAPHKKNALLGQLYDLMYNKCDAIHHMGQYSYDYLKERTDKSVYHFIVEHQAYYNREDFPVTKEEARKYLKLEQGSRVILCFGAFRFDEERQMVLNSFKALPYDNKVLLAPSFFKNKLWAGFYIRKFRLLFYKKKYKGVLFTWGFITKKDLPYYLIAADILLIQRKNILNSGNLPLGLSFGKVVVGPDKGNVGTILTQTGNPAFNPDDPDSINKALIKGFENQESISASNLQYAKSHLEKGYIARQLIDQYQLLLSMKNRVE